MSGDDRDLQHVLQEFHEVLEGTEDLEASERAMLQSTLQEIRSALGQDAGHADSAGLVGRLRKAVEGIEDRYPRLTEAIGRVADSLSELGI